VVNFLRSVSHIFSSNYRHYLLDLMRVTPRDANYSGSGSRFCILRPELIKAFLQVSFDIFYRSIAEFHKNFHR
jgi:hypothetical protein